MGSEGDFGDEIEDLSTVGKGFSGGAEEDFGFAAAGDTEEEEALGLVGVDGVADGVDGDLLVAVWGWGLFSDVVVVAGDDFEDFGLDEGIDGGLGDAGHGSDFGAAQGAAVGFLDLHDGDGLSGLFLAFSGQEFLNLGVVPGEAVQLVGGLAVLERL